MVEFHLKELGIEAEPHKLIVVPSHHLSHAYLAYFLSPFEEAVIMVADNEGSLIYPKDAESLPPRNNHCEKNTYYWAKGNNLVLIDRDFEKPTSAAFGKAYNRINKFIGLGDYHSAGKTMGLSSYGKITDTLKNIDIWSMDDDGKLHSNMFETGDSTIDVTNFFAQCGLTIEQDNTPNAYKTQQSKDLACFVQEQLNKWSVRKVKSLIEKTGLQNVCISGGVALNGIMNKEIEHKLGVQVFVPPFASDPGQGLGNAIYAYIQKSSLGHNPCIPKITYTDFAYAGTAYNDAEIGMCLDKLSKLHNLRVQKPDDTCYEAAKLISEGKIIGWFQGKSEYGARALGNRSILADPRSPKIRDTVNILKGRELFRPLAPSVLSEYVPDYFEGERSLLDLYMLKISIVKKHKREEIKGVNHIDNTSRIQEVTKEANPKYYELIKDFLEITGTPMVMNTSFNMAGEPIVESPSDAVKTFLNMNLDALFCEGYLVTRND